MVLRNLSNILSLTPPTPTKMEKDKSKRRRILTSCAECKRDMVTKNTRNTLCDECRSGSSSSALDENLNSILSTKYPRETTSPVQRRRCKPESSSCRDNEMASSLRPPRGKSAHKCSLSSISEVSSRVHSSHSMRGNLSPSGRCDPQHSPVLSGRQSPVFKSHGRRSPSQEDRDLSSANSASRRGTSRHLKLSRKPERRDKRRHRSSSETSSEDLLDIHRKSSLSLSPTPSASSDGTWILSAKRSSRRSSSSDMLSRRSSNQPRGRSRSRSLPRKKGRSYGRNRDTSPKQSRSRSRRRSRSRSWSLSRSGLERSRSSSLSHGKRRGRSRSPLETSTCPRPMPSNSSRHAESRLSTLDLSDEDSFNIFARKRKRKLSDEASYGVPDYSQRRDGDFQEQHNSLKQARSVHKLSCRPSKTPLSPAEEDYDSWLNRPLRHRKNCNNCLNHGIVEHFSSNHKYACKYKHCCCVNCLATVLTYRGSIEEVQNFLKNPDAIANAVLDVKHEGKFIRQYNCKYCRNHNKMHPHNLFHTKVCPYRRCCCFKCLTTVIKLRSAMWMNENSDNAISAANESNPLSSVCRYCENHNIVVASNKTHRAYCPRVSCTCPKCSRTRFSLHGFISNDWLKMKPTAEVMLHDRKSVASHENATESTKNNDSLIKSDLRSSNKTQSSISPQEKNSAVLPEVEEGEDMTEFAWQIIDCPSKDYKTSRHNSMKLSVTDDLAGKQTKVKVDKSSKLVGTISSPPRDKCRVMSSLKSSDKGKDEAISKISNSKVSEAESSPMFKQNVKISPEKQKCKLSSSIYSSSNHLDVETTETNPEKTAVVYIKQGMSNISCNVSNSAGDMDISVDSVSAEGKSHEKLAAGKKFLILDKMTADEMISPCELVGEADISKVIQSIMSSSNAASLTERCYSSSVASLLSADTCKELGITVVPDEEIVRTGNCVSAGSSNLRSNAGARTNECNFFKSHQSEEVKESSRNSLQSVFPLPDVVPDDQSKVDTKCKEGKHVPSEGLNTDGLLVNLSKEHKHDFSYLEKNNSSSDSDGLFKMSNKGNKFDFSYFEQKNPSSDSSVYCASKKAQFSPVQQCEKVFLEHNERVSIKVECASNDVRHRTSEKEVTKCTVPFNPVSIKTEPELCSTSDFNITTSHEESVAAISAFIQETEDSPSSSRRSSADHREYLQCTEELDCDKLIALLGEFDDEVSSALEGAEFEAPDVSAEMETASDGTSDPSLVPPHTKTAGRIRLGRLKNRRASHDIRTEKIGDTTTRRSSLQEDVSSSPEARDSSVEKTASDSAVLTSVSPRSCAMCRNHGIHAVWKGHKKICPFNNCTCDACHETIVKRRRAADMSGFYRHLRDGRGESENEKESAVAPSHASECPAEASPSPASNTDAPPEDENPSEPDVPLSCGLCERCGNHGVTTIVINNSRHRENCKYRHCYCTRCSPLQATLAELQVLKELRQTQGRLSSADRKAMRRLKRSLRKSYNEISRHLEEMKSSSSSDSEESSTRGGLADDGTAVGLPSSGCAPAPESNHESAASDAAELVPLVAAPDEGPEGDHVDPVSVTGAVANASPSSDAAELVPLVAAPDEGPEGDHVDPVSVTRAVANASPSSDAAELVPLVAAPDEGPEADHVDPVSVTGGVANASPSSDAVELVPLVAAPEEGSEGDHVDLVSVSGGAVDAAEPTFPVGVPGEVPDCEHACPVSVSDEAACFAEDAALAVGVTDAATVDAVRPATPVRPALEASTSISGSDVGAENTEQSMVPLHEDSCIITSSPVSEDFLCASGYKPAAELGRELNFKNHGKPATADTEESRFEVGQQNEEVHKSCGSMRYDAASHVDEHHGDRSPSPESVAVDPDLKSSERITALEDTSSQDTLYHEVLADGTISRSAVDSSALNHQEPSADNMYSPSNSSSCPNSSSLVSLPEATVITTVCNDPSSDRSIPADLAISRPPLIEKSSPCLVSSDIPAFCTAPSESALPPLQADRCTSLASPNLGSRDEIPFTSLVQSDVFVEKKSDEKGVPKISEPSSKLDVGSCDQVDSDESDDDRLYIASDVECEEDKATGDSEGPLPEPPVAEEKSVENNNIMKSKKRYCAACRQHGHLVPVRGHKNQCPFKNCVCDEVCNVREQRKRVRRQRSQSGSHDPVSPPREKTGESNDSSWQGECSDLMDFALNEWAKAMFGDEVLNDAASENPTGPSDVRKNKSLQPLNDIQIMCDEILRSSEFLRNSPSLSSACPPPDVEDNFTMVEASGLPPLPAGAFEVSQSACEVMDCGRDPETVSQGPLTPDLVPEVKLEQPWENSEPTNFICCDCGLSLLSRKELAEHRLYNHAAPVSSACLLCPSVSWSPLQHEMHQAIAHDPPYYRCERCHACFPSQPLLTAHAFTAHSDGSVQPFPCPRCPTSWSDPASLSAHLRVVHRAERLFPCELCGSRYDSPAGLVSHHRRKHLVGEGLGASPKLRCLVCCYAFPTREILTCHMYNEHAGQEPFLCPCCGRSFKSTKALQIHVRTHPSSAPFSCRDCDQRFGCLRSLLAHACECRHMIVALSGPFSCRVCPATYADPLALADHEDTVHMGLLPMGRLTHLLSLVNELPAAPQPVGSAIVDFPAFM